MYLIAIFLLIVLVSPILAGLSMLVGTDAAATRSFRDVTAARAGVDSVALWVARRMRDGDGRFIPPADRIERSITIGGDTYAVEVESELGKLDINVAPAAQLARLFVALGATPDAANGIARQIEAVRTVEPAASDAPVNQAGPRPRGRFVSVDELGGIDGVSAAMIAGLRRHLTVSSGRAFVDPRFASEAVLLAITEFDAPRVEAILRERSALTSRGQGVAAAYIAAPQAYSLRVALRRSDSAAVPIRRAVVLLRFGSEPRFQLAEWSEADR